MNKTELIWAIADRTGIPTDAAGRMITALQDSICETLSSGQNVVIPGFGTFACKNRSARKGRNPKTGEELLIPACRVPVFRAGKRLRDSVNGG